jgi:hypothetical protein
MLCAGLLALFQGGPAVASVALERPGYTLVPPSGDYWDRQLDAETQTTQAVFLRRSDNRKLGLEVTHSFVVMSQAFFAAVNYADMDMLREQLAAMLKSEIAPDPMLSLDVESRNAGPENCISYRRTSVTSSSLPELADRKLVMEVRGIRCLHEFHPGYIVDLSYSQRWTDDGWYAGYDHETVRFLGSLRFLPVDLSPYVGRVLSIYESKLRQERRTKEAERIAGLIRALRQPPPKGLTFDPPVVLREFASFLEQMGETENAKLVINLTERWMANEKELRRRKEERERKLMEAQCMPALFHPLPAGLSVSLAACATADADRR